MQAVILAAGEGKRLRPLTKNRPKVMIPVANKPILQYVIESLASSGIEDIVVVVGYREESITSYFRDGSQFGVKIRYVRQTKRMGTAHALYQARNLITEDFIVLPGDNIVDTKCIQDILLQDLNTVLATHSDETSKYGSVIIGNEVKIMEKSDREAGLIFTGIAKLSTNIFDKIEEGLKNGIYDLPDVLNEIENLKVSITKGIWMDAIYPWDLLKLNYHSLRHVGRSLSGTITNANIVKNVHVGEGTKISNGVFIKGPAYIGDNCVIGENSVIMPGTTIGDNVTIGAFSYIENSIIMNDSSIGKYSLIQNSVIGKGCSIGDRFTSMTGEFKKIVENEIVEKKNFGVVVGDDCVVGAMVTTVPGVLIGNGSKINPMKHISSDINDEERWDKCVES